MRREDEQSWLCHERRRDDMLAVVSGEDVGGFGDHKKDESASC